MNKSSKKNRLAPQSFFLRMHGKPTSTDTNYLAHLNQQSRFHETYPATFPPAYVLSAESHGVEMVAAMLMASFAWTFSYFYGPQLLQRLAIVLAHVVASNPKSDLPRPINFSVSPKIQRSFYTRPKSRLFMRDLARYIRPTLDRETGRLTIETDKFAPIACLGYPKGTTALVFTFAVSTVPDFHFLPDEVFYTPVHSGPEIGGELVFVSGFIPRETVFEKGIVLDLELPAAIAPVPEGCSIWVVIGVECYRGEEDAYTPIRGAKNAFIRSVLPLHSPQDHPQPEI